MTQPQIIKAINVIGLLAKQGLEPVVAAMALAQIMHETNGFQSRVFIEDNNLSGLKYYKGNPLATPGRKSPEGNYYAKYKTFDDWAKDYIKTIRKAPGNPAGAVDLKGFVHRLKVNKFFTDTEANYYAGVLRWGKVIATALNTAETKEQMKREWLSALTKVFMIAPVAIVAPELLPAVPAITKAVDKAADATADAVDAVAEKAVDIKNVVKYCLIGFGVLAAINLLK